jgi:hypothetical protein
MAINIKSPRLSFVQIEPYALAVICGKEAISLPFSLPNDLKFQLLIQTSTIAEADSVMAESITNFNLRLVKGGLSVDVATIQANTLLNYSTMNKHFSRYRIGLTTILLYWSHGLAAFDTHVSCEQCFKMAADVKIGAITTIVPTNTFYRSCDPYFTSVLEYTCDENAYGFNYCEADLPNRVRLPLVLTKPQFQDEESIYTRSDGSIKILKSVTKEEFEGKVDYLNKDFHERIKVALSHDNVSMESDHYTGGLRKQGGYEIEWIDFMMYTAATAKFKALATPYLVRNNNCEVCEPADLNCPLIINLQSYVTIDPDPLKYNYNLNWNTLPSPQVIRVVVKYRLVGSTNWTIINSNNLSQISISLLIGNYEFTVAASGATCLPVFSSVITVNGVVSGCAIPTGLSIGNITQNSATASWVMPTGGNSIGIEIDIQEANVPPSGSLAGYPKILAAGTTQYTFLGLISSFPDGQAYQFQIRNKCAGGGNSAWVELGADPDFTTLPPPQGNISLTCQGGSIDPIPFGTAGTYNFDFNINTITAGDVTISVHSDQSGSINGFAMYYTGIVTVGAGQTSITIPLQYSGGGVNQIYNMTTTVVDTSGTDNCTALFGYQ